MDKRNELPFSPKYVIVSLIIFCSFFSPRLAFSANSAAEQEYQIRVKLGEQGIIIKLSFEKYLCGVLKGEVSFSWPLEALKAMAVSVRTYTFNQLEKNRDRDYDIMNSVFNQVYQAGAPHLNILQAVRETNEEVVTYQGKLAAVFYHCSSGGKTANIADIWPSENNFPYLSGVDDPYSIQPEKYYPWKRTFDLESFSRKFSGLGRIKKLRILEKDSSGRVKNIELSGEKRTYELTGKEFRYTMNLDLKQTDKNYFPSTLLFSEPEIKEERIIFTGYGSGHGVGLSQWGAKKMAEEGISYEDILRHYFPGTEIGKVMLK